MKRITFIEGIGAAFILTLLAIPITVFSSMISRGYSVRTTLVALTTMYLVYLIATSTRAGGKSLLLLGTIISGAALILITPSLVTTIFGCTAVVCIARSVISYKSVVTFLIDAGVSFIAAVFALWSFVMSGSAVVVIWTFFLVHSAAAWIPVSLLKKDAAPQRSPDPFQRACEAADEALQVLARQA